MRTYGTDPFRNLAIEQRCTEEIQEGEILLYLWQNAKTVVIGRNQNAWKECDIHRLEQDGGTLARRFSGGGAVFHDLGNLNFSFCVRKEDYDVDRQLEVILRAVRSFGLEAEKTGRNDLTIHGMKFSGNAFLKTEKGCCHHGTLLLETDAELLGRYLTVSKDKLASKGVDSVRSRVRTLKEWAADMTIDSLCQALEEAFYEVYGMRPERVEAPDDLEQEIRFLSFWDWRFGRKIPFTTEMDHRFPWGGVDLKLLVDEGRVRKAKLFTDAMDPELSTRVEQSIIGQRFRGEDLARALSFQRDLSDWIRNSI